MANLEDRRVKPPRGFGCFCGAPSISCEGTRLSSRWDIAGVELALLEKHDGPFFLALWVEKPSYDVHAKKLLTLAVRGMTIRTKNPMIMNHRTLNDDRSTHTSA